MSEDTHESNNSEPEDSGPKDAEAVPPQHNGKIGIVGIFVLAACTDKQWRQVNLTPVRAQKLFNFLMHKVFGGGPVSIATNPIAIVQMEPAQAQPAAAPEPEPKGLLHLPKWMKRE